MRRPTQEPEAKAAKKSMAKKQRRTTPTLATTTRAGFETRVDASQTLAEAVIRCNPAFRPDKKLEVNKNRMLVFFITSRPVATSDRVQATPAHEIE